MTNPWLDQVSTKHTVTKLVIIGWVATIIVATNQWAFTVDPKQYTDSTMRLAMYLYWAGWLLLILGTQILALLSLWGRDPNWVHLMVVGATRPLSILLIHFKLNAQTGNWYFGYLTTNPIFITPDIILPGVLLYFAWRERDNEKLLAASSQSNSQTTPVSAL